MYVKTVKFNRKKAVFIIIAAAVILAAIVLICSADNSGWRGGRDAGTAEDCAEYLKDLGWEVDAEQAEAQKVVIPQTIDGVLADYNELQRKQGFDLSNYCGMECIVYTFPVTNYKGYDGEVFASVLVVNKQVVGGDIHSSAMDGFMHTLK